MADIAIGQATGKRPIRDITAWDRLKVNRNWLGFWFMLPALGFLAAAPTAPAFAAAPAPAVSFGNPVTAVRGVSDNEIRFGITAAFTGPVRERGRQMKLGIETAFNQVNDAGGVGGRKLRIIAADDGNEPTRTLQAVRQLYEKDQIFGLIGSIGTATAAVAVPFALERRMLFFGAYTGGNVVRRDPPDRYVFNYRPSYAEEADAAVRCGEDAPYPGPADRRVRPAGRSRRCRLCRRRQGVSRARYQRQRAPAAQLPAQHHRGRRGRQPVETAKAAGQGDHHVRLLSGRRQIIEKTRNLYPEMIFTSISASAAHRSPTS